MRSHTFRSMGTDVSLLAPEVADAPFRRALGAVEVTFGVEDRRFSRFRADSELSRVNARAGAWTTVSKPFARVLAISLEAADQTGGLFDPTVLHHLVAAGYDRDFDSIEPGGRGVLPPSRPAGAWRDVEVDGDRVRLPEDSGLDFGGIAKGWTVDRAAERSGSELAWRAVNAGGDLQLTGSPGPGGLEVGVTDPDAPDRVLALLRVQGGAIATSSIARRTWGPGLHHLIDPRTGLPSTNGVVQATVWEADCARAEVWAKWALLTGPAALDRVCGLLVLDDGRVLVNLPAEIERIPA
jgi:thiamine biosynthesis lipoprotein